MLREIFAATVAATALLAEAPATAAGPEQLEQLEPDQGKWQAEYFGLYVPGRDVHSLQALYGIADRLAVGLEVEGRAGRSPGVDGVAPTVLYRFADADPGSFGVGLEAQAEISEGGFGGAEARLILERRERLWWGQADVILRHEREDGDSATGLAYAWSLSGSLGKGLWLGAEGSGQAARLGGARALAPAGEHYLGPSLTAELGLGREAEVELGFAYLRRLKGHGPANAARVFVQFTF